MTKNRLLEILATADASSDERMFILAAMEGESKLEDQLTVGAVFTSDNLKGAGVCMVYNALFLSDHVGYLMVYSFYKRRMMLLRSSRFEPYNGDVPFKVIGHINPDSIFKEDINYGVQEN